MWRFPIADTTPPNDPETGGMAKSIADGWRGVDSPASVAAQKMVDAQCTAMEDREGWCPTPKQLDERLERVLVRVADQLNVASDVPINVYRWHGGENEVAVVCGKTLVYFTFTDAEIVNNTEDSLVSLLYPRAVEALEKLKSKYSDISPPPDDPHKFPFPGGLRHDPDPSQGIMDTFEPEILDRVRTLRMPPDTGNPKWVSDFYSEVQGRKGRETRDYAGKVLQLMRKAKKFTKAQCYLIMGMHESFGNVVSKAGILKASEGRVPSKDGGEAIDLRFDVAEAAANGLKLSAKIGKELEWVAAHLHEDRPDFTKAPSVTAANMFVDIKDNDTLKRDFWQMCWKVRQPRVGAGKKESPLVEDEEVEVYDPERDRDLAKQLFGDEE